MTNLESRAVDLGNIINEILKQFQSVHAVAASCPHAHLTQQELRVVEFLGGHEPQMMRAISEYLGVAVNSVTSLIDSLELKNMVQRVRCATDRRIIRIELTDEGRRTFDSAMAAKSSFHRAILSVLTEDEQEILLVLFRKIARAGWTEVEQFSNQSKAKKSAKGKGRSTSGVQKNP